MLKSNNEFSQLTHICSFSELKLYELIPNIIWIFDIDKHGWWWGNQAAIEFWGLTSLQDLIDKDLSDDTQGARDRTEQTFELAVKQGVTHDPWTTYPDGKPKTLMMMHRAVLLGPNKHRGIIAFINEQVSLGEQTENLLLMEAMRYTRIPATTFSLDGKKIIENPSATETYKHLLKTKNQNDFLSRFADPEQGAECFERIRNGEEGRWDYRMQTSFGERMHSLDIRRTRHPLNGDFLFLVVEYDFTELQNALNEVEVARQQLHELAMNDTLTGVHSLHYLQINAEAEIAKALRHKHPLIIMFIDLDGFKNINDQYGHEAGDVVLQKIAQRIQAETRAGDVVARLGGDEFVVMLSSIKSETELDAMTNRILHQINQPFQVKAIDVCLGASIGIASCPEHGQDLESLLKAADDAMYIIKKQGKNAIAYALDRDINL